MVAFDYIALDRDGRQRKGVMEADTERQIRQMLREKELSPVQVREVTRSRPSGFLVNYIYERRYRLSLRELSVITRQLATLVESGLPVEVALQALIRQNGEAQVKSILAAVRAHVLEGQGLAESLASFPHAFPEIYRTSIAASERSGHLAVVLEHLADYTESSHKARQKVLLSLLYPGILTSVSLLIVIFLLNFVVPDVIKVFTNAGQVLPPLTRGLIAINDMSRRYGLFVLLCAIVAIAAVKRALWQPAVRLALHRRMLHWPLVGRLALMYNTARFAATLSMLLDSGVPLVQALQISGSTLSNLYLRMRVQESLKRVSEGTSLAKALDSGQFPPILLTMIASGEASGTLDIMLKRASAIQQNDFENRTAIMMGLLEPLMLLLMGALVLLLVIAIIVPILNLNQLV